MYAKYTLLFAALQGLTAAIGNAVVSNRCPYDVYVSSVSQNKAGPMVKIPSRTQYKAPLNACEGCATALKISKTNKIVGGHHTQLEYVVAANQLWFDISLVDCANGNSGANCPGWDMGLAVDSPEPKCGKSSCKGSTFCPAQAYFVDQPLIKQGVLEPVFTCPGAGLNMDLVYKLCADEAPIKRSLAGRLLADTIF
jgi:hypothetical protein